jgi:hypothetical protein
MSYPGPFEIYRRFDLSSGKEEYVPIATFEQEPTRSDISDAFSGRVK